MLRFGRRELIRSRDLEGGGRESASTAALKRTRICRCRATADSDADAADAAPALASSSSRRGLLFGSAAAAASALAATTTTTARAALLVLDDDSAAERAYAAASPAVVGLAAERRPGEPLVPLGSGTVWAAVAVDAAAEESGSGQYNDLYVVATYRQVAGFARADERDAGGLPSLRIFVGDGGSGSNNSASATTNNDDDSIGPYAASVLGLDPTRDLAVLRARVPLSCPARALPLAAAGQGEPRRGQAVFLLGRAPSAAALPALSSGVVSAVNRSAPAPSGARLYGAVQIDAKVGLANVGGPVVDSSGALVGVAVCPTFSLGGSGGGSGGGARGGGGPAPQPSVQPSAGAGISFALPARALLEAVPNLAAYGTASGRV